MERDGPAQSKRGLRSAIPDRFNTQELDSQVTVGIESAEDAAQWGERLEGAGNYRIVEVEFSTSVAENLVRWGKLDGIGPARYGELHQLQGAVVRLWRS